ncbi:MAG: response regulator [Frankiaceae bacterium]|nr:response regulator [Frankiaceae bacterium]
MRVLVCDDDKDVGQFLRTLFDLQGWETDLVTDGEACLAAVETGPEPEALILDQLMPGLTGIETADRLRAQGFERPIILCSGHLGAELGKDIKRLDLIPCSKIDIDALVRIVRVAVAGSRSSQVDLRDKTLKPKKPTKASSSRPKR